MIARQRVMMRPSRLVNVTGVPIAPDRSLRLCMEWGFFSLSVLAVLALSAFFIDPVWSLVSTVNFLWLATLLFRTSPVITVLILPMIFSRLSSVTALVFIEYGAPIPELGMMGEPGIYTASYVAYTALYFGMIAIFFSLLTRRLPMLRRTPLDALQQRFGNWIALGVIGVVTLLVLALVANGLKTGFPLLTGTDRFMFRRTGANAVVLYALNFKYPIMFLLGVLVFRMNVYRRFRAAGLALAISLFFIYFLFGDKFFIQIKGLCAFGAPYLMFHHAQIRRRLGTYVLLAVLALGLLSGITWEIYSQGGKLSPHATQIRLAGRMVGQGELWFIENKVGEPAFKWEGDFISRNIKALTILPEDLPSWVLVNSVGPSYFSNRYTPAKIRHALRNNSGYVTFTAAQDAVGMATFGWAGLIGMLAACAALMALVCSYAAYAVARRSAISGVFAAVIFMQLDNSLVQASPWALLNIYPFRWVILMLTIEIFLRVVIDLPFRNVGPGGLRERRKGRLSRNHTIDGGDGFAAGRSRI